MSFLCYLENLQSRKYSFRAMQKELSSRSMPSAQGWGPLLKKYNDPLIKKSDKAKWSLALKEIYDNHIRFSSKAILMFEVDKKLAIKVAAKLPEIVDINSPFRSNFPLSIGYEALNNTKSKPIITWAEQEDNGVVRLISCCKRAFREREQIVLESLNTDALDTIQEAFTGFEEIYGIRCGLMQSFDCIVIRPNEKRLEIQIDNCRQLTVDELLKIGRFYRKLLNAWVKAIFNVEIWLNSPINFYPMIDKLYNEEDGYVSNLAHVTGTNSIKEERMRRGRLDLRDELFHKEGLQAVGTTDAYSLTKKWQSSQESTWPSLTIHGYSSHAGASDAKIEYVLIDDCNCQEDFDMVLDNLF